jgi:hypothetical protein
MPAGDDSPVSRQDVEALMAARRELGPDYDAALADSFAERVERAVAERAVAWVGIVGVNAAHALSSRPRRDEPRHRP